MMLFAQPPKHNNPQSLLGVYFQAVLYFDTVLSYFLLAFQYLLFIYKYNILYYTSATIAVELILLTVLLPLNGIRLAAGTNGNKGKKYSALLLFAILDILLLVGYIYVMAIQANALYL